MLFPLKIHIQAEYLIEASIVFLSVAIGILVFIAYYLFTYIGNQRKKQHLRNIYSDFLSEIILCETKEELVEVLEKPYVQSIKSRWLWDAAARKLLAQEMVKIDRSLSGVATDNIHWLYVHLELYKDALNRLTSKEWFIKAKAIQELAEMKQSEYITRIYRETNSKNDHIRTEAQIAVVKLTGVEGLRFLNVLSHPISQWQQICLLEQLPEYELIEGEKISKWLQSANDSVVEFALRLIERYNLFEQHDAAILALSHPALLVQQQAVRTLVRIHQDSTHAQLSGLYPDASASTRLHILEVLKVNASPDDLSFLMNVAMDEAELVRLLARQIAKSIEPKLSFEEAMPLGDMPAQASTPTTLKNEL